MTLDQQAQQATIELEWAYIQGGLPLMVRVMLGILKQLRQADVEHGERAP